MKWHGTGTDTKEFYTMPKTPKGGKKTIRVYEEEPGGVARSDARPTGIWTVGASILTSGKILSLRLKLFLRPFSPFH